MENVRKAIKNKVVKVKVKKKKLMVRKVVRHSLSQRFFSVWGQSCKEQLFSRYRLRSSAGK
jgi:hypothetical protein